MASHKRSIPAKGTGFFAAAPLAIRDPVRYCGYFYRPVDPLIAGRCCFAICVLLDMLFSFDTPGKG